MLHKNKNIIILLAEKNKQRLFSTKPHIIYMDSSFNKPNVLIENKEKSGVYR
jgi:hypothetical protein